MCARDMILRGIMNNIQPQSAYYKALSACVHYRVYYLHACTPYCIAEYNERQKTKTTSSIFPSIFYMCGRTTYCIAEYYERHTTAGSILRSIIYICVLSCGFSTCVHEMLYLWVLRTIHDHGQHSTKYYLHSCPTYYITEYYGRPPTTGQYITKHYRHGCIIVCII